jgi:maltooligosyltrehalose synthase
MMDREYDIFEILEDGSVTWRATVHGLRSARLIIAELAKNTGNEHFAMNLPTGEVVFPVDTSQATSPSGAIKRIFQIAYTDRLRDERTELLRRLGYAVISVIGNEAARVLLSAMQHADIALFIVGHAAAEQTRNEMVDWLKAKYPNVKVLALNPPYQQLPDADFNAVQNGPEKWLPFVSTL